MRVAYQILIFMVAVNLMAGVMTQIYPGFTPDSNLGQTGMNSVLGLKGGGGEGTVNYVYTTVNDANSSLGNAVSPTGSGWFAGTTQSFFNSIFDVISGGLMQKIGDFTQTYIFGISTILANLFSNSDSTFFAMVNGSSQFKIMMNSLIFLLYTLSLAWLWTGRNVVRESL